MQSLGLTLVKIILIFHGKTGLLGGTEPINSKNILNLIFHLSNVKCYPK